MLAPAFFRKCSPTKEITICAWVKARSWRNLDIDYIVSKDDFGQGGPHGYLLRCSLSGKLNCWLGTGATEFEAMSPEQLEVGRWYHVAATYDGNKSTVFVDGLERSSLERRGAISPSSYNLRVGRGHFAPDRCFDGVIDEVAVFGRALTAKEIQSVWRLGLQGKSLAN